MTKIDVNLSDAVQNFTALITQATKEEYAAGMGWYLTAHNECRLVAIETGIDFLTVCEVVAALSPFTLWEKNIGAARIVIAHFQNGGSADDIPANNGTRYYASARKAFGILAGTVKMEVKAIKTYNFSRNIAEPTECSNITVDFHMIRAAKGEHIKWGDMQKNLSLSPCSYAVLCSALVSCASHFGILPLQAQAIVWIVQKRLHGGKEKK